MPAYSTDAQLFHILNRSITLLAQILSTKVLLYGIDLSKLLVAVKNFQMPLHLVKAIFKTLYQKYYGYNL